MLIAIEGTYRNGKVELAEQPAGIDRAKVVVTFLPEAQPRAGIPLKFGEFSNGREATDEDFRLAEWRGEHVDDN